MKNLLFPDCIEAICSQDPRYSRGAYAFLNQALQTILKKQKKPRKDYPASHVNAIQLLEGFRAHALKEFGPMTSNVLDYWGVHSCKDIGNMVYNLIEAGVFGKTDEDSLEDFEEIFDFYSAFEKPFLPSFKQTSQDFPKKH
ncbi:MAG: Minf_1886 family protein [Chthoniobacterales bacterium]